MKKVALVICLLFLSNRGISQNFLEGYEPVRIFSFTHDPDYYKKHAKIESGSFYKSKEKWQAIIDSTWGPGLPFAQKLELFDNYTFILDEHFDGFQSLGLDWTSWDSLKNHYRSQINDSTSRGRFCAIMNYFTNELRDGHTKAIDYPVYSTPLNPGIPFICANGFVTVEHFGAVTTALSDCTSLILRVVDNHPLDLHPGDIILGYERIPYHIILNELLDAHLPGLLPCIGSRSAERDFFYKQPGMNWHLFDTIDILQYTTGDTLHLPLAPMVNLNTGRMLNNEQIEIPGIPFPDKFNGQFVTYGILRNKNIGYIYLFSERNDRFPDCNDQFFEAVSSLKNTEGLIIDMRWNEGGWAFFDQAFRILFNKSPFTLNGVNRCNSSTFEMCSNEYEYLHQIKGDPKSLYDHPIALLLGSTCVSMGDRTAHRLSYHPMLKRFGKPPGGSFGLNRYVLGFPDWFLRLSIEDMFHLDRPDQYLNRSEFPIDIPVWFNPDDVARGEDTVVKTALNWICNLAYAHEVSVDETYIKPVSDPVRIRTKVQNPNRCTLSLKAHITNFDNIFIDSLRLFDDGMHGDFNAGDNLWGNFYHSPDEQSYNISVVTWDSTKGTSHTISNAAWFTSIGPVSYDGWTPYILDDSLPNPGDILSFKLHLKNDGHVSRANNVAVRICTNEPMVTVHNRYSSFPDIGVGERVESDLGLSLVVSPEIYTDTTVYIKFYISSNNHEFWSDSIQLDIITTIDKLSTKIPANFGLSQNYPNPFNPVSTIPYQLPISSHVEMNIYNLLGQKVATLLSERQRAGYYQIQWDASEFASGVYYYRLSTDAGFVQTKKLVLLK